MLYAAFANVLVPLLIGRNQDAWRLNTPCENIVIRHCDILKGHTLLGIGSEMSGGVRNAVSYTHLDVYKRQS